MIWCATRSHGVFHDMLNIWIRSIIKRVSLTATEAVFCLLDFLDVVLVGLDKKKQCKASTSSPVDVPFILHTIHILLAKSDHTINLLRALSFVYSHFAFLTSRAVLLDMLCNRILLEPYIFEKLLLHWSRNVRHFFWRCLFWRVGRVWSQEVKWPLHPDTPRGKETCDGHSCFRLWCDEKTDPIPCYEALVECVQGQENKAYKRCALEVHILLESMLASLSEQHNNDIHLRSYQHEILDHTHESYPVPHFTSMLTRLVTESPRRSVRNHLITPKPSQSMTNTKSSDNSNKSRGQRQRGSSILRRTLFPRINNNTRDSNSNRLFPFLSTSDDKKTKQQPIQVVDDRNNSVDEWISSANAPFSPCIEVYTVSSYTGSHSSSTALSNASTPSIVSEPSVSSSSSSSLSCSSSSSKSSSTRHCSDVTPSSSKLLLPLSSSPPQKQRLSISKHLDQHHPIITSSNVIYSWIDFLQHVSGNMLHDIMSMHPKALWK